MSYLKGQGPPEDLSVVHLHLNLAALTETQWHKGRIGGQHEEGSISSTENEVTGFVLIMRSPASFLSCSSSPVVPGDDTQGREKHLLFEPVAPGKPGSTKMRVWFVFSIRLWSTVEMLHCRQLPQFRSVVLLSSFISIPVVWLAIHSDGVGKERLSICKHV